MRRRSILPWKAQINLPDDSGSNMDQDRRRCCGTAGRSPLMVAQIHAATLVQDEDRANISIRPPHDKDADEAVMATETAQARSNARGARRTAQSPDKHRRWHGANAARDTFCTGRSRRYAERRTPPASNAAEAKRESGHRLFRASTDTSVEKKLPNSSTTNYGKTPKAGGRSIKSRIWWTPNFHSQPRDDKEASAPPRG